MTTRAAWAIGACSLLAAASARAQATPAAPPLSSSAPAAVASPPPPVASAAPASTLPSAPIVPPAAVQAAPAAPTIAGSFGLLLGVTRLLLDGDASNLAALGVRGHFRPVATRFALDVSFVHAMKISGASGSHLAVESVGLGLGYDLDVRSVSLRPSLRAAFAVPRSSFEDPGLTGPIGFSSGLAIGAGLAFSYPATGAYYVGADFSAMRLGQGSQSDGTSPSLWLYSGLADIGLRFAL